MSDGRRKLVQLPDGSWVQGDRIIGVSTVQGEWNRDDGATRGRRVSVQICLPGDVFDCRLLDCNSLEDAEALRDRIAAMANNDARP